MDKKTYIKPAVVTRTVALGVFGHYGRRGQDDVTPPLPIFVVTDQKLRME